jgi:hypothetical protein
MLPIPVNMMCRGPPKSPIAALSPARRVSSPTPLSFIDMEIAELEKMLPGPISPVRRSSFQFRSSIDRDVSELEKMLSPMRRDSIQIGASFWNRDLDAMIPPNSPVRRGSTSRAIHTSVDAEGIVDCTLDSQDSNHRIKTFLS